MVVTDIVKGEPKLTKLEKDVISAAKHGSGDRVVLVLNKVDRLKRKDDLLPWMAHYQAETGISAIIPVSALKKDGLDKLESYLLDALPESKLFFRVTFIPTKQSGLCAKNFCASKFCS